ncbi:hypothetical protein B0I35DRAFT_479250 [Stachybotrys elegans]|uniref:Urease accessory protein UreD n=1 Tax=Stachybotrys elegans TaxID=80388 RepID=A0A8K0WRH4_9HYPO|nr:hypothetical protein B0I35DRAFT_479250 [Stachybotrys elegans]
MPHKHKRKGGETDDFDLPPTQRARPLPVAPSKRGASQSVGISKKRSGRRGKDDDAPRAFKRLMALASGKKTRSGLDDGSKAPAQAAPAETAAEIPKIRPGEDLRSYAARVDAALPVSGLTRKTVVKDGKDEHGFKVVRTRKERKMHKLYDQWRAEDLKIKEQREEEMELAAERELENDAAGLANSAMTLLDEGSKKKKKKKSKGGADDDDPWLELKRKRAEGKIHLHDVAQAPPQLHKQTTRQLKVRGAAVDVGTIPKAAGSLRRREELQVVRNDVLDAYRKIKQHEQAKLDAQRAKNS